MSTSHPQQQPGAAGARNRRARAAVLAVLAVLVGVVVAVLLTRGGMDDLAGDVPLTAASEESSGSTDEPAGPDITVDGLRDARLGQPVTEDDTAWVDEPRWAMHADPTSDCRFVVPTSDVGAPGMAVAGWVVDGRLASVMVMQPDYRIPYVTTPYGIAMDDGLGAAALLPDAELTTEELDEPARPRPDRDTVLRELRVVTVPAGGREVLWSDLGGDRGIEYVEVREPSAAQCVLGDHFEPPAPPDAPTVTPVGWGEVRLGRPVAELAELGLVEPEAGFTRGPCAVHSPTDAGRDAGLSSVEVLDGRVAGVAVLAGRTEQGLAIGARAGDVQDVYPDAVPDLGPPGEQSWTVVRPNDVSLEVTAAATGFVVPDSVDVYLFPAEEVVALLHLRPTACTG